MSDNALSLSPSVLALPKTSAAPPINPFTHLNCVRWRIHCPIWPIVASMWPIPLCIWPIPHATRRIPLPTWPIPPTTHGLPLSNNPHPHTFPFYSLALIHTIYKVELSSPYAMYQSTPTTKKGVTLIQTCPVCNHSQLDGNFCAVCGNSFSAVRKRTTAVEVSTASSNDSLEKLKTDAKNFTHFLIQQLNSPSGHFQSTSGSLQNSILSILLFVLLTSAAFYAAFPESLITLSPSFFQVVLYLSIFFLLVVAVNLIAATSTAKLFSIQQSISELTRKLGGFYAIPIALSAISLLLTFVHSYTLSAILLSIAIFIAFLLIPLITISKILFNEPASIDSFYGILFYIAVTTVASILLAAFIADTAIGEILRLFQF